MLRRDEVASGLSVRPIGRAGWLADWLMKRIPINRATDLVLRERWTSGRDVFTWYKTKKRPAFRYFKSPAHLAHGLTFDIGPSLAQPGRRQRRAGLSASRTGTHTVPPAEQSTKSASEPFLSAHQFRALRSLAAALLRSAPSALVVRASVRPSVLPSNNSALRPIAEKFAGLFGENGANGPFYAMEEMDVQ